MPPRPFNRRDPTRAQARRGLVAGSAEAAVGENYRYTAMDLDTAESYIFDDVGFDREEEAQMFAIVETAGGVPRTPRRSLADLSASTRRNYLGSRAAQQEAALHGMTAAEWYEVAPDVKAFRRKAGPREFSEPVYHVYIARTSDPALSQAERRRLSTRTARAVAKREGRKITPKAKRSRRARNAGRPRR